MVLIKDKKASSFPVDQRANYQGWEMNLVWIDKRGGSGPVGQLRVAWCCEALCGVRVNVLRGVAKRCPELCTCCGVLQYTCCVVLQCTCCMVLQFTFCVVLLCTCCEVLQCTCCVVLLCTCCVMLLCTCWVICMEWECTCCVVFECTCCVILDYWCNAMFNLYMLISILSRSSQIYQWRCTQHVYIYLLAITWSLRFSK